MKHLFGWVAGTLALTSLHLQAKDVDYRLPGYVKPSFQQIHLTIDPDKPDYTGTTLIDIDITKSTDKVGFYQLGLSIDKAELLTPSGSIPLNISEGTYDINWGTAASDLKPDHYQLAISFHGKVNTSSDGMYLSNFEGRNYLFTQFEDMHARRAFPSFDEPGFKIPYQLTITAPEGQTVASNTPVESSSVADGQQTVAFMKTKPMPTYLVAYTVGPLDSADITGLSVPGKIYVPKGYADKTKFVVANTPQILKALESFFGIDYPYRKLDFVAVPNFTHGAMENAGLVTFRSSLLLLEDEPDLAERGGPLNVVAHELAHMWYGDLVTMAWWDDLWLNEAFASWMASHVMMQLYPELNYKERIIQEGAFGADASPTTKPVKKVVRSQSDVMDGLGLNYSKGESILQMIESLMGTEKFRQGIQAYMKKHAWRNTQADDLWQALDNVADFNLSKMMKAYLEQPGYPLVSFGENGSVTQSRFHLAGADVKAQTWAVPLNLSYKKQGKISRKLVFIDQQQTTIPEIAEADWVFPNDNATGYFRWQLPARQMQNLLKDINALNAREKKNLLYNINALLTAGKVSIADVMSALNTLAVDQDQTVVRAAVATLNDFLYLVNDDNKAAFAKLINARFAPTLDALTLSEGKDEDEKQIRLRQALYSLLGLHGENAVLQAKSEALAEQYLADTTSVPSGLARTAIAISTIHGDSAWFDKLLTAYRQSDIPNVKNTLLFSMSFESDAMVGKMLDLALTDDVTPANTIYMVMVAAHAQDKQNLLYQWLGANMDKLAAKMPAYHIARMPEFVSNTCDQDNLDKADAFYAPLKEKYEGMARSLEVMQDESKQCISLKNTYQDKFDKYLSTALPM